MDESSLNTFLRRLGAWFICHKRPPNARSAWLMAVACQAGLCEYRCPCGRCDLPIIPPAPRGDDDERLPDPTNLEYRGTPERWQRD